MFIFMSGHKMESIVHYVNRSGVMWHFVWEYHQFKIENSETAFCFMNSFYSEHVQETGCGIGAILWLLFVSNYIVMKKTMNMLFSLSQRKVFSFILFYLWKIFQLYIDFTNRCIFHKEMLWLCWCICTTLFIIFSKSYLVIFWISIVNSILR